MKDIELIANIKNDININKSLNELVNRHSGIFYEIINKYVPADSEICSRNDMFNERDLHIYNTALKFNPNKGAKFSTFLGNETKWLCLNSYNKAKRKFCENKTCEELDFFNNPDDNSLDLNLFNEIYFIIEKHPDSRVSRIFKMRYKDGNNHKLLPWKKIAPAVNLSIQGCINIHDNVIKDLKNKLLKKEIK